MNVLSLPFDNLLSVAIVATLLLTMRAGLGLSAHRSWSALAARPYEYRAALMLFDSGEAPSIQKVKVMERRVCQRTNGAVKRS